MRTNQSKRKERKISGIGIGIGGRSLVRSVAAERGSEMGWLACFVALVGAWMDVRMYALAVQWRDLGIYLPWPRRKIFILLYPEVYGVRVSRAWCIGS